MGEIAKLLGDKGGAQIGQQVALRATKAAALATRPSPSQDRGYAYVDFDQPAYRPQGVRSVAFVPGAYAEEPELFYGPFLQLGTYMKGKGMIESEGVAFAIDLALDPLNLVSAGTAGAVGKLGIKGVSGLTQAGKLSRLVSAVSEGGRIRNGAQVVDKVVVAIEAAGKVAGKSDEIRAAAMAGNDAALDGIVKAALASDEIVPELRTTLEAFKRDRKSLGKFLEHLDEFKAMHELPSEAFLQPTVAGRIGAGQVEPLLSVAIPSNPLRHPLRFTRQMLGFHYANERFAVPMTTSALKGLDKVGAGSLFEVAGRTPLYDATEAIADLEEGMPAMQRKVEALRGEVAAAVDLDDKSRLQASLALAQDNLATAQTRLSELRSATPLDRIAAEAKEADAFAAAGFRAGDLDAGNAIMAMHMARILPGSPTERMLKDVGYEAVNEETMAAAFKRLPGNEKKAAEGVEFEKFREDVVANLNGARRAIDQERVAYRDSIMDQLTDEYRRSISADPATQAEEAFALSSAQADIMVSQLRRTFDIFSLKSLAADAYSPGNGLAARAEFQGMMARATTDNVRSLLHRAYKGQLAREFMAEIPQAVVEHPSLFTLRDGRYFLTASPEQIKEAGADFLLDSIQRSKGSRKSAFLETHLRTEGIDPQISRVIGEMGATYQMIGKNLVQNEGVLKALRDDYFSHVFRPNEKYYKTAHLRSGETRYRETLSEEGSRQLDELMGEEFKVLADRANQGKVTFEEARRFSEAEALRFEKMGLGTYVKDGVSLFSGYLDAAGKSVLINRLWRDLPEIADALTPAALGKRGAGISDKIISSARRVMNVEPPRQLLPFYKRMFVRPRVLSPGDDPQALVRQIMATKELAAAEENARKKVAARLSGKKVVGGYRLRDKVTGEAVTFDPDWVLTDSIPDSLVGAKEIKGKVKESIDSDSVLGRLRGEVTKAREAIQGKAVKASQEAAEEAESVHGGLWVFEDDYNHLAEAFAIREKPSSAFLRKYDRWNSAFKSVVLIGDIFHFNVLAISQALLNPASIAKHLYDDAGRLLPGAVEGGFGVSNAAVKAGIGAAGGAATGLASGADEPREVLTWSLVGALYGAVIGAAMNNARTGLRAAMNPANVDTLHWMGVGGWRGRPDDRSIGLLNRSLKGLRDKIAREEGDTLALHAIDKVRHLADAWDDLLWSTLHNGSKHYYFQVRWAKELPRLEARAGWAKLTDAERYTLQAGLAREIVQTSNNVFGGQTFRFLFDNPEFQHIARRFLLSPDWTFSRLALASGFFMNMDPAKQALVGAGIGTGVQLVESGADPEHTFSWRGPILGAGLGLALGRWAKGIQRRMVTPGDVMARESRRVASAALLGGYVFANAVNYGLTGRWLHENPEGKRTSIDIGDGNWVALGKPWVEAFEFGGFYEPEKYPIPVISRAVSKGAGLPVLALRVLSNRNGFGGPIILPDDSPFEIASKLVDVTVPLPILGQGPARLALSAAQGEARPGAAGAAAIRTLGFPVRGPGRGGMPMDLGAFQRAIQSAAPPGPPPSLRLEGTLLEGQIR